jgi:hypothetical protein
MWTSISGFLRRHRVQLALSVRVTIAALAALLLAERLQLTLPLWSVLTAVIVTQMSMGRSLMATIDYLIGTLGGAIWGGAIGVLGTLRGGTGRDAGARQARRGRQKTMNSARRAVQNAPSAARLIAGLWLWCLSVMARVTHQSWLEQSRRRERADQRQRQQLAHARNAWLV